MFPADRGRSSPLVQPHSPDMNRLTPLTPAGSPAPGLPRRPSCSQGGSVSFHQPAASSHESSELQEVEEVEEVQEAEEVEEVEE